MSALSRQALIGAGANLGDRHATLRGAIERLRRDPKISAVETSSLYETAPVGLVHQPMFLNLVIGIATTLSPEDLLGRLIALEQAYGRIRTERWGPRTLDLDLLAFEGETRATDTLQVPHPRMLERAFVTEPLHELLARPAFRRPCWSELRARLVDRPPPEGVRVVDVVFDR